MVVNQFTFATLTPSIDLLVECVFSRIHIPTTYSRNIIIVLIFVVFATPQYYAPSFHTHRYETAVPQPIQNVSTCPKQKNAVACLYLYSVPLN